MAGAAPDPAELDFVLAPDIAGINVRRHDSYDLHARHAGVRVPVVVFVHGPVVGAGRRPRDWPVYRGYAALTANEGIAAAVLDLDYTDVHALSGPITQLGKALEEVRLETSIDPGRVAVWAFSGGARLVGGWLEQPPPWLKGVALTYPVVPALTQVAVPVVVTRVGLEHPAIQATVDAVLELVPAPTVINVDRGHHGFDMLDHDDESKRAVRTAVDAVVRLLV
jgi:acetyl esterase/lipase